MLEEDLEIAIKVVIVGNGAVGKSSIIQRYCKGTFTKDYKKTIGVDFLEKQIEVNEEDVRLMLWDTAGQEEFDAITKAYYRGAQACLITFSTTDRESFLAVKKWKKKVEDECGDIPMVLVQNKIDLLDQSVVNSQELDALSHDLKLKLYKTSVKDNINVCQVFHALAEMYIVRLKQLEGECDVPPKTVGIGLFSNNAIMNGKSRKEGIITLEPLKRRTNATKQLLKSMCSVL